ncbi:GIY-YIG nuclease family protein [Niabella sp. 22666]|uniref:GIY-YIG nuclease family protein n=1 Tax=Niabella sp. 22666 TaxID=3453954 RepID=UPI003F84A792
MKRYYVYILKCADSSYYTGVTGNLEQRLRIHESGENIGCYTYSRRPLTLVTMITFMMLERLLHLKSR